MRVAEWRDGSKNNTTPRSTLLSWTKTRSISSETDPLTEDQRGGSFCKSIGGRKRVSWDILRTSGETLKAGTLFVHLVAWTLFAHQGGEKATLLLDQPLPLSLPPALSDSSMTKRTRKFVDVHGAAARKISAIQVHREAGTRVSRARPIVPACGTRASSREEHQSDSGRRSRK